MSGVFLDGFCSALVSAALGPSSGPWQGARSTAGVFAALRLRNDGMKGKFPHSLGEVINILPSMFGWPSSVNVRNTGILWRRRNPRADATLHADDLPVTAFTPLPRILNINKRFVASHFGVESGCRLWWLSCRFSRTRVKSRDIVVSAEMLDRTPLTRAPRGAPIPMVWNTVWAFLEAHSWIDLALW